MQKWHSITVTPSQLSIGFADRSQYTHTLRIYRFVRESLAIETSNQIFSRALLDGQNVERVSSIVVLARRWNVALRPPVPYDCRGIARSEKRVLAPARRSIPSFFRGASRARRAKNRASATQWRFPLRHTRKTRWFLRLAVCRRRVSRRGARVLSSTKRRTARERGWTRTGENAWSAYKCTFRSRNRGGEITSRNPFSRWRVTERDTSVW